MKSLNEAKLYSMKEMNYFANDFILRIIKIHLWNRNYCLYNVQLEFKDLKETCVCHGV